jgi:hypothetical protein
VRRWFEEVWNKGRADAIEEMLAEDAVIHGLGDPVYASANRPAIRPARQSSARSQSHVERE